MRLYENHERDRFLPIEGENKVAWNLAPRVWTRNGIISLRITDSDTASMDLFMEV